jgi:hypothetical protein
MPQIRRGRSIRSCWCGWGDEPPDVRAADAGRIHDITAEFGAQFGRLASIGPAATVFGSARTAPEHPHYGLMREVGAALGRARFAVITGGASGLMEAANRGATLRPQDDVCPIRLCVRDRTGRVWDAR